MNILAGNSAVLEMDLVVSTIVNNCACSLKVVYAWIMLI